MSRPRKSEVPALFAKAAFTLVEIVVALTIAAVVAAVAIPTLKGLGASEKARGPMKALAEIVQEVRQRALREHRAYQIVFEREGIHASPAMHPFAKRDDFLKHLEEMRTPPPIEMIRRTVVERTEVVREETGNRPAPEQQKAAPSEEPRGFKLPWTATIPLPPKTECDVLMWGDGEWEVVEGDKMRRWVFQPTGMANPGRVRLRTDAAELEGGFDLLTGELTSERTRLAAAQP